MLRTPAILLLSALLAAGSEPAAQETLSADQEAGRVRIIANGLASTAQTRVVARLDEALERFVPWLEGWTGAVLPESQQLVLRLHPTIKSYRTALLDAGFARFLDAGAVTLWRTRQSHVVLQPRTEDAYLESVDCLPELTLQLALHELVHQFSERAGLFRTEHQPLWYSEGLAEELSWRALARLAPERASLLHADARALVLEKHTVDDLFPLTELFGDGFEASGYTRRGLAYAQSGLLVRFLRDRSNQPWASRFRRFERTLHDTEQPGRRTLPLWSRSVADRILRRELVDLPELWSAWTASLTADPTWRLARRSAEWAGDNLVVASFAWSDEAVAIAPDARRLDGLDLGLELQVLSVGDQNVFVAFAANPTGDERLELRLRADGEMLVSSLRDGEWTTFASAALPTRGVENPPAWHSVRITCREGSVRVDYDGARLLSVYLPDDFQPAGSAWGLGTWKSALIATSFSKSHNTDPDTPQAR